MSSNDESEEFDEEKYEEEMRKIDEEFPDVKFTIAIPYDELDDVVIDGNQLVIEHDYTCICCDGRGLPSNKVFFNINSPDKPITNRLIINELIKHNFDPGCNHHFLEFINKKNKNNLNSILYELALGS